MSKRNRLINLGSSIEGMMSHIGISTSMSKDRLNQTAGETNPNQNDESRVPGPPKVDNTATVSEAAFLSAIYNTIAIAIFFSCLALCALAYVVLQAFIRSILWALLTSAFLFAFKRYLTDMARSRLVQIDKNNSTLAIELLFSPFRLIDSAVDCIWSFIVDRWRSLLIAGFAVVIFHLANSFFYESLFGYLTGFLGLLARISAWIIYYADTRWQYTCGLLLAYTIAIAFYWKEEYCTLFQILSLPVWLSIIFFVSRLMGSTLRPIFVIAFLLLSLLGIYSYVFDTISKHRRKLFAEHHAESAPLLTGSTEAPAPVASDDENDEEDDERDSSQIHKVFDHETSSPTFYSSQTLNPGPDDEVTMRRRASDEVETLGASTMLNKAMIDTEEPQQPAIFQEHPTISTLKRTRPKNLSFNLTGSESPVGTYRKTSIPEPVTALLNSNESLPIESNSTKIEPVVSSDATCHHDDEATLDDHDVSISSTASSATFFRSTVNFLYQTSLYYFKDSPAKPTKSSEKVSEPSNSKVNQSVPGLRTLLRKRERKSSDKYFKALFWLFVIVKLRYDMYVIIPILVLLWKLIRFVALEIYQFIFIRSEFMKENVKLVKVWFFRRRAVLAPRPFSILLKLFRKGDHKMNQMLQKSMDSLVSALMIIALILFVLVTVVVLAMQVHSESVQLISITSNILNENIYTKPELRDWLPEKAKLNELYQSSMNSFYLYGREWLSSRLRSSSGMQASQQPDNIEYAMLEKKILAQWDSLYAYLSQKARTDSMTNGSNSYLTGTGYNQTLKPFAVPVKQLNDQPIPATAAGANKTSLWPSIKMLTTRLNADAFDYNHLAVIIKDNLGILVSILDSVYSIVRGNLTLLTTVLLTFLSLIFNSGFALMNFFFSMIVYFTALFYLLAASDSQFKPLQWITEISFFKGGGSGQGNSNGSSQSGSTTSLLSESHNRRILLSKAIEESIRSVFFASLKMSSFYGIFTWLIHSSFGISIVYLPSITAALFGFLPLFGTYWAAFPGVLELWLIQGKPFHSIAFIVIHILPTYVVDTAIYSQIKAGHPYLTGLAFAGGVYCLGLEGAIIGPIVLCLLIVIVKLLTSTSITTSNLNATMTRTYSGFGSRFTMPKSPSLERC